MKGSTKGFTLIEVLVILIIIAILAAIAVPTFLAQNAKRDANQINNLMDQPENLYYIFVLHASEDLEALGENGSAELYGPWLGWYVAVPVKLAKDGNAAMAADAAEYSLRIANITGDTEKIEDLQQLATVPHK
jgi:prepilin-type N-terminal cleavage/methylation domain-containing protein